MSSDATRPVIELESVCKAYDRDDTGLRWRQMAGLAPRLRTEHRAVDDVSLAVEPGTSVALIGPNGAGKSTLLKLVAGVCEPTSGSVGVRGSIGALIELGVGFHPELTGLENARATLVMQGRTRREIDEVLPSIIEFAGIGDAMTQPTKRYSQGMAARLAFAVATSWPVDVLAVDEVLAVGDREFQLRCFDRIRQMVDAGTALLFVTHEMPLVPRVCGRAIQLRQGRIVDDGPAADVVERYLTGSMRTAPIADSASIRIVSHYVSPDVAPLDRIAVDLEVEVRRPTDAPAIVVELTPPTLAPNLITASATSQVPALRVAGRHLLRGRSSVMAVQGIRYRAITTIIDQGTDEILARCEGDLEVHGVLTGSTPRVTGHVEGRLWPVSPIAVTLPPGRRSSGPDAVAVFEAVTKRYRRTNEGDRRRTTTVALDRVDLSIRAGESVGVIGPNGAGKTTLLRLLTGVTAPTTGSVTTTARVLPMLDVSVLLHPEVTGRDNIAVAHRLLSGSTAGPAARVEEIIEFAGIGAAIDEPVRHYSSGMRARLGFAVAAHAPGEILAVDEILTVGDQDFRARALDAITRRVEAGASLVLVSHELSLIERMCDRTVLLERGQLRGDGDTQEVIGAYAGAAWSAGPDDAAATVRILPLALASRAVDTGGKISLTGTIIVEEPGPDLRFEVALRLVPDDRLVLRTSQERLAMDLLTETIEPAGGQLRTAGTYRFEASIDRNDWIGSVDVVACVLDERSNEIRAETFRTVSVGAEKGGTPFPRLALEFEWTERPADPSPAAVDR